MSRPEKVYCPVCQARFVPGPVAAPGAMVICPVCGQTLLLSATPDGGWEGTRPDPASEQELRSRIEEFARLRGYVFGELKEELVEGMMAKAKRFGDCYCPCRLIHEPAYLCPCRPTRGGDVERLGRCHCGLFLAPA